MIVSMLSYRVIKHVDVIKYILLGFLPIDLEFLFNTFSFEQLEETSKII